MRVLSSDHWTEKDRETGRVAARPLASHWSFLDQSGRPWEECAMTPPERDCGPSRHPAVLPLSHRFAHGHPGSRVYRNERSLQCQS
jgi:hypothetical protein